MNQNNSEIFIKYYSGLEAAIRKKYKYQYEPVKNVADNELIMYKEELDTMRNLRNVLSHSKPFGIEYCAEPHNKMLANLKRILEEIDDSLLINNCVKIGDVEFAKLNDKILEKMNKMHDNIYTHIPILDDNNRVIGVFGENTLFSIIVDYANKNDFYPIEEDTAFQDIEEYLGLDKQKTEEFCFMSKYDSIMDAKILVQQVFKGEKRRLGMIFITENGKPTESLLGILTIWGIEGRDKKVNYEKK